jgi:hypothetical protein
MADKIRIQRAFPFGTGDWRAIRGSSTLFDINLQISSMRNGSCYFVLGADGNVITHGRFHVDFWDPSTMRDVLVAIVTKLVLESDVDVELDGPQPASRA